MCQLLLLPSGEAILTFKRLVGLLFFHVQPTIMGVALRHKTVGGPWLKLRPHP